MKTVTESRTIGAGALDYLAGKLRGLSASGLATVGAVATEAASQGSGVGVLVFVLASAEEADRRNRG